MRFDRLSRLHTRVLHFRHPYQPHRPRLRRATLQGPWSASVSSCLHQCVPSCSILLGLRIGWHRDRLVCVCVLPHVFISVCRNVLLALSRASRRAVKALVPWTLHSYQTVRSGIQRTSACSPLAAPDAHVLATVPRRCDDCGACASSPTSHHFVSALHRSWLRSGS